MKKSTLLHLRIPFSFFLLPVFLLALGVSDHVTPYPTLLAFLILHFMVYPASNGYNSYFDKDEKSIGGLKKPPKVSKELYWVSLLFDGVGLASGALISFDFVWMIFVYGLVSKAYSHPLIRLKKMPFIGWLAAGIFQGYFTFLLSYLAINELAFAELWEAQIQVPGILSSILLLGSYPMTQVYQHGEDEKRGDLTISRILGILHTFHFTAIWFTFSTAGFVYYFRQYFALDTALLFLFALLPVLLFFGRWYFLVRKDRDMADYKNTMNLNLISSACLNAFFFYLYISH
ncbi:MAG: UbiA family prenyltransferase [Bacteroidota bacterium]